MDTETKEAVLKLAGYEIGQIINSSQLIVWVVAKNLQTGEDVISTAEKRRSAINLGFYQFVRNQNDVVDPS
jgi:hypothetical protein